jgi:hypothetical protein
MLFVLSRLAGAAPATSHCTDVRGSVPVLYGQRCKWLPAGDGDGDGEPMRRRRPGDGERVFPNERSGERAFDITAVRITL